VRQGAGTASQASVKIYPLEAASPSVEVYGTGLANPVVPNKRLVLSSAVSGVNPKPYTPNP